MRAKMSLNSGEYESRSSRKYKSLWADAHPQLEPSEKFCENDTSKEFSFFPSNRTQIFDKEKDYGNVKRLREIQRSDNGSSTQ